MTPWEQTYSCCSSIRNESFCYLSWDLSDCLLLHHNLVYPDWYSILFNLDNQHTRQTILFFKCKWCESGDLERLNSFYTVRLPVFELSYSKACFISTLLHWLKKYVKIQLLDLLKCLQICSKQSVKTTPEAYCGSDHELFIVKFRLKLKKVGKSLDHSGMT